MEKYNYSCIRDQDIMHKGKMLLLEFAEPRHYYDYPTRGKPLHGIGFLIFVLLFNALFLYMCVIIIIGPSDIYVIIFFVPLLLWPPFILSYSYFAPVLYNPGPDIYEHGILLEPKYHESRTLITRREFIAFDDIERIVFNPSEEGSLKAAMEATEKYFESKEKGSDFSNRLLEWIKPQDPLFYYQALPLIENEPEESVDDVIENYIKDYKKWIHIIQRSGKDERIQKERIYDMDELVGLLRILPIKLEV